MKIVKSLLIKCLFKYLLFQKWYKKILHKTKNNIKNKETKKILKWYIKRKEKHYKHFKKWKRPKKNDEKKTKKKRKAKKNIKIYLKSTKKTKCAKKKV